MSCCSACVAKGEQGPWCVGCGVGGIGVAGVGSVGIIEQAVAGAVRGAVTAALDEASDFLENVWDTVVDWAWCELYPGACEAKKQLGAFNAACQALWVDVQANIGPNPLLAVALAMALRDLHTSEPFVKWAHMKASWYQPWAIRANAVITANKSRAAAEAQAAKAAAAASQPSKYVQKAPLAAMQGSLAYVSSAGGGGGAGMALAAAAVAAAFLLTQK